MPQTKLVRESEKYSHTGNISAEGIQRLLGAPNLDRLQTVIRETVQNTWDARSEEYIPYYVVRLRKLTEHQVKVLESNVLTDLPGGEEGKAIRRYVNSSEHWVLEISDYGTSGLGGETDPSLIPEDEVTDFVDFMRNIGTPRDTEKGGGTYGYGKSSLYAFSQCATILVDTLTQYQGRNTRRLMGCRIGRRFDIKTGHEKGRYTGRHWWGIQQNTGEGIAPLTDAPAITMAIRLGFVKREEDDHGTTIMIIDPDIDTDEPEKAVNAITYALLWNFWPKMLVDEKTGQPSMEFEIWLNGHRQKLLAPDDCPPLTVYADAMRKLKRGKVEAIRCERPKQHLGELAIVKAPIDERPAEFRNESGSAFPEVVHHVALMRPAELVIKYLEGPQLPGSAEWGGVFICDENHEVEHAFAESEPPAHDDWIPGNLPAGHAKTFVRVALRKIKQTVERTIGSVSRTAPAGDLPLSKAADILGGVLAASTGDALGKGSTRSGRKTTTTKKAIKKTISISDLRFDRHAHIDRQPCSIFTFRVNGPDKEIVRIHLKYGILLDSNTVMDETPDGQRPTVAGWYCNGHLISKEESVLEYQISGEDDLSVAIIPPGDVAVDFYATVEPV